MQKQSAARRRTTGPRTTGLTACVEVGRWRRPEVGGRISEIGELRFQTKKSRAAKAAKTGMFRKLGFRSAHSPIQPGIQAISRMFGDGAREQIKIAASNASARATKTNFKELATD